MAKRTITGGYKNYNFRDHDPVLDALDRLHELSQGPYGGPMSFAAVERRSGVTVATLRKWRTRQTRRPQFATVKAVAKALGGELAITYQGKVVR